MKNSGRMTHWIGTTGSLMAHTVVFIAAFSLPYFGVPTPTPCSFSRQLSRLRPSILPSSSDDGKRSMQSIEEVEEDVGEVHEQVQEISRGVGLSEDVEEFRRCRGDQEERKDEMVENTPRRLWGKSELTGAASSGYRGFKARE